MCRLFGHVQIFTGCSWSRRVPWDIQEWVDSWMTESVFSLGSTVLDTEVRLYQIVIFMLLLLVFLSPLTRLSGGC